jgi:hypothetical protein
MGVMTDPFINRGNPTDASSEALLRQATIGHER